MAFRALLILGLAAAVPACSERSEEPPKPDNSAAAAPAKPVTPGQSHLAQTYGISDEEAQRRLAAQEHASALARGLRLGRVKGFADLWIDREPRYAVVVGHKAKIDRAAVLERAHPSIRGDIVFRPAKRTRWEVERDGDRIIAAFKEVPSQWAGGYDVRTDKFEFSFASPDGLAHAEKKVPADLKEDVILKVGAVPQPQSRTAPVRRPGGAP